jgi:hypothetical protein
MASISRFLASAKRSLCRLLAICRASRYRAATSHDGRYSVDGRGGELREIICAATSAAIVSSMSNTSVIVDTG